MKNRIPVLPPLLIALAALMVLTGTCYFASLRPDYSHVSNTISELGETGAPHAHEVAFGFFLPVGLLVWLAIWLVHRRISQNHFSPVLIAMSCLGTGYALSAFFPCDPGAPLFGTWRTLVHNALAIVDYAGTGIGFFLVARYSAHENHKPKSAAFSLVGAVMLACLGLLALQELPIRGAVQRVAEIIQFAGVFSVCLLLSKKMQGVKRGRRPAQQDLYPQPLSGSGRIDKQ